MSLPEHVEQEDRTPINKLVKAALVGGNTLSLFDGEEWTVKRTTTAKSFKTEMASTDSDTILVRNSEGKQLGQFFIIFNDDGYPICDYTDNEYCNMIFNSLDID